MARGRKPVATAIREANGAFVKNPQLRNKKEPKPKQGRPIIPKSLRDDPVCKNWWKHTCDLLAGMNLLTVADTDTIESYCLNESLLKDATNLIKLHGLLIVGGRDNTMKVNPACTQWQACMDRRIKLQAELGLTISARTRMTAGPKEEEDPISDFLTRNSRN